MLGLAMATEECARSAFRTWQSAYPWFALTVLPIPLMLCGILFSKKVQFASPEDGNLFWRSYGNDYVKLAIIGLSAIVLDRILD